MALGVLVGSALVDLDRTHAVPHPFQVEGQGGVLRFGGRQLGDFPADSGVRQHLRGAVGGGVKAGDAEAVDDGVGDHDVGGAGLGDGARQILEQLHQLRLVRGDGQVIADRGGDPPRQGGLIQPAVSVQADGVDGHALVFRRLDDGGGVAADGGLAVGEEDHHLGVGVPRRE